MSPLEQALSTIQSLTAEEKRRLRDFLDAELTSTAKQPQPAVTDAMSRPTATNFGWARDFLVIRDDFDAPLEEFRDYM